MRRSLALWLGGPRNVNLLSRQSVAGPCFAVFGILTVQEAGFDDVLPILFAALVGGAFGVVSQELALRALVWSNKSVRAASNVNELQTLLRRQTLMLVPFTLLAIASLVALDWQTSQPFAAAALMTTGSMMGSEMAQRGGGRWSNLLIPSLGAFVLTLLWTVHAWAWRWIAI